MRTIRFTSCVVLLASLPIAPLWARSSTQRNKVHKTAGARMERRADAVHNSAIVIDTHADTTQRFADENFDLASDAGKGQVDLAKIKKGNLGAEFFAIWVDPDAFKGQYAHRAFDLIDAVHEQVRRHPADMVMAYSADDIVSARKAPHKRLATLIGVEGGHSMENDLRILRDFYRLGARYMTLTHTNTNEWADSSGDVDDPKIPHHGGLTPFGKDVIREMNRLGMMVDVSHVADSTFWDVINTSRAPIIASHSSARALTNAPRNMTDEMLKAVTKNGGVVMVNYGSFFLDEQFRAATQLQADARNAALKQVSEQFKDAPAEVQQREHERVMFEWYARVPRPPFSSLIDHIDHIAKVAGMDHVGLGSDFDGVPSMPEGMDSCADLPKVTEALLARGYSAEDVRKILGGNLLRVFRQVERVSHEMRSEPSPKEPATAAVGSASQ